MPKGADKPNGEEVESVLQCEYTVDRTIFEELVFYFY